MTRMPRMPRMTRMTRMTRMQKAAPLGAAFCIYSVMVTLWSKYH